MWHPSLKGKLAGKPSHPLILNAAKHKPAYQFDQPLVHKDLKWPFPCGICGKKGHHFMECGGPGLPPTVKRDGSGKEIVTMRQLFADKYCDKVGKKQ